MLSVLLVYNAFKRVKQLTRSDVIRADHFIEPIHRKVWLEIKTKGASFALARDIAADYCFEYAPAASATGDELDALINEWREAHP